MKTEYAIIDSEHLSFNILGATNPAIIKVDALSLLSYGDFCAVVNQQIVWFASLTDAQQWLCYQEYVSNARISNEGISAVLDAMRRDRVEYLKYLEEWCTFVGSERELLDVGARSRGASEQQQTGREASTCRRGVEAVLFLFFGLLLIALALLCAVEVVRNGLKEAMHLAILIPCFALASLGLTALGVAAGADFVARWFPGAAPWKPAYDALLGLVPDEMLAVQFGCPVKVVQERRQKLKIPPIHAAD
jgi:hypothetical protein